MDVEVDISDKFGEVNDQGRRLTCLAFAATAAHEYCQRLVQPLSVEWLYYHGILVNQSILGDPLSVKDIALALPKYGQPYERVWPYEKHTNFRDWNPPPYPGKRYYARCEYKLFDIKQIVTALKSEHPVIITFWIDNVFVYPKTIGNYSVVERRRDEKNKLNFHAVLAVGYGYTESRLYLKVRNSWSRHWGMEGYGWVSEEFWTESGVAILQLYPLK